MLRLRPVSASAVVKPSRFNWSIGDSGVGNPVQHTQACLSVLESLVSDFPDVEIVITSSWREEKSVSELKALLGAQLGSRVIGATPIIDEPFLHHVRYHEAQAYLSQTSKPNRPWVAVDDEGGNYPEHSPVVITDRRRGLTKDDGQKLKTLISEISGNTQL